MVSSQKLFYFVNFRVWLSEWSLELSAFFGVTETVQYKQSYYTYIHLSTKARWSSHIDDHRLRVQTPIQYFPQLWCHSPLVPFSDSSSPSASISLASLEASSQACCTYPCACSASARANNIYNKSALVTTNLTQHIHTHMHHQLHVYFWHDVLSSRGSHLQYLPWHCFKLHIVMS